MSILTPADVRPTLDWPEARDDELQLAIDRVEADFATHTRRVYDLTTTHEEILTFPADQSWRKIGKISLFPLTSIRVQPWEEGETRPTFDTDANDLSEGDQFSINLQTGTLDARGSGYDRLIVRASGGYDESSLPNDIKQAWIVQIALVTQRDQATNIAVTNQTSSSTGDSVSFRDQHPLYKKVIGKYRMLSV
jgi:hypothetical protein